MKTNIVSQTSMTGKSYTSVISKKKLLEGFANKSMEQFSDHGITLKAEGLVKKVGYLIGEDWTKLRKSGNPMDTPVYRVMDKDNFVTIKPVYHQFKNSILMEIEDNNNHIDRILINRQKPSDYTYERAVITPYGSASGKTYNSQKDNDSKIETRVNDYITKYFDKVLTNDDGTSKLTKKYHR